jgi:hypothetical protein
VRKAVDSSSSSLPPWPAEWSTPRLKMRTVLTDGFLGLLALGSIGLGALALSSGALGHAAFLLMVGVFFGSIATLSLSMWRTRRPGSPRSVALQATGSNYEGVTISFSARLYNGVTAIMLMGSAFLALYATGGIMKWKMPPFVPRPGVISVALSVAGALFCLWLFTEFATGRIAKGYLTLTPGGIYHRSHTFDHFVPWDTVLDVSAVEFHSGQFIAVNALPSGDTRVRRTHWIGKQEEFRLLPFLVVRARSLAADPAVAYHALRYYFAHPEARAELLMPAGEQRIRSGNLFG